MAETQRVRIVANKGRRGKMTAKQIRFFGTKAQRAALKTNRSKHRKRSTAKRTAAKRSHRAATRRRTVKRNAGEIVGYTLVSNKGTKRSSRKPAKKGTHKMASTKKARRRSAGSGHKKHRRPATRHNTGHRRRSTHRRNPGLSSIGPLITTSAFALAGAAASKIIPQLVLGASNTSWVGYAANALTGFLLYMAAEKILKNRTAAQGVAIGTAVMIMDRMINDMTPFGSYLSGAGFGDYQAQAFVTPQVLNDPYNNASIRIPGPWLPAPAAPMSPSKAAAAVGVGAYGGGNLYGGGSSLY